jgi:hypothetical protein
MTMMGMQAPAQGKLYYTHFNLDQCIRPSHPLRRIDQQSSVRLSVEFHHAQPTRH